MCLHVSVSCLHVPTCMLCTNVYSIEAFMYLVVLCSWCKGILRVCVSVCHQKSMVAHLVVFRPGLWRQTAGDEEESSALQFRNGSHGAPQANKS